MAVVVGVLMDKSRADLLNLIRNVKLRAHYKPLRPSGASFAVDDRFLQPRLTRGQLDIGPDN
jgi:hypothetical protein